MLQLSIDGENGEGHRSTVLVMLSCLNLDPFDLAAQQSIFPLAFLERSKTPGSAKDKPCSFQPYFQILTDYLNKATFDGMGILKHVRILYCHHPTVSPWNPTIFLSNFSGFLVNWPATSSTQKLELSAGPTLLYPVVAVGSADLPMRCVIHYGHSCVFLLIPGSMRVLYAWVLH